MRPAELDVIALIGGRPYSRSHVLAWEDRRIDAAARKLGVVAPPAAGIARRREDWLGIKRSLGAEEMQRRLARDIAVSNVIGRAQAKMSARRRRCVTELFIPGASSSDFTEWFNTITFSSDEDAMMRACPDHFVLRMGKGGQEVIETNGGSPLTARFAIDYDDVASITTPVDPIFPWCLDGVARADDGTALGGVRHQFRDTPEGVHARLLVEFPLPMLQSIIRGHRWHLACEFSNWFEAATAADKM